MAPELVETFVAEFHAEVNRLNREREHAQEARHRELDEVSRKLDGLIEAIAEGLRSPGLQAKLEELELRKQSIEAFDRGRATTGTATASQPGRALSAQGRTAARGHRRSRHPDRGARDPAWPGRQRHAHPDRGRVRDRARRRDRQNDNAPRGFRER